MTKSYDIDANVEKLLGIEWGEFPDGEEERFKFIERALIKNAGIIHEIAQACRETGIFKDSSEKYGFMKATFEEEANKLARSYHWFLNRITEAPTQLHMRGSVRLCLPIVDDFLQERLKETNDG